VALLDFCDAGLFIPYVDALAAGVLVVPGELLALPQRTHQRAETFGPRYERHIRLAIRDQLRRVVHQHLWRVAAGRPIAGLGGVRAQHVRQRLRGVRVTAERKTGRIRAVGDEADGGDVVDDIPELPAEAGVGGSGLRRIRHQVHRRLRLLDILFLLDELAAANQNGHTVVDLGAGHEGNSLRFFSSRC